MKRAVTLPATAVLFFLCQVVSFAEAANKPQRQLIPPAVGKPAPPITGKEEISDWVARWELARVLGYAGRYDEAVAEYRKLLAAKPDLHEARIELASIIARQGKTEEVRRELERVPLDRIGDKARLLLAEIYAIRKEYPRAEVIYRDHLNRHSDDLEVRLKLAELLSWEKKYDDSLAEYEKILKARPDDIQVRRKYAFVLIWKGDFDKAAAELRKTLK